MCRTLPYIVICIGCSSEVTVDADLRVTALPPIRCVTCQLRLPYVDPMLVPTVRCPDCNTKQFVDDNGGTKIARSAGQARSMGSPGGPPGWDG